MFHKMPIVLLGVIASIFLFDGFLPLELKSFIYALSLSVKSVIIFSLPIIIFMLLFKTVAQLSKDATKIIVAILAGVCLSNFLSTMISYQIGSSVYHMDLSIAAPEDAQGLVASWDFSLPKVIANDIAMFSGLFLGVGLSLLFPAFAGRISQVFDE